MRFEGRTCLVFVVAENEVATRVQLEDEVEGRGARAKGEDANAIDAQMADVVQPLGPQVLPELEGEVGR